MLREDRIMVGSDEDLDFTAYTHLNHLHTADHEGIWSINPVSERPADFRFNLAIPEGDTFDSVLDRRRTLDREDPEYWRLGSMISLGCGLELGYGETQDDSIAIINCLRRPCEETDPHAILMAAEFSFKYDVGETDAPCRVYNLPISRTRMFSVSLRDSNIWLRFEVDGRNGWENLYRLARDLNEDRDGKPRPTFWPAATEANFMARATRAAILMCERYQADGRAMARKKPYLPRRGAH